MSLTSDVVRSSLWFEDGKVFQLCDVTDPLLRDIIAKAIPVEEFDVSIQSMHSLQSY